MTKNLTLSLLIAALAFTTGCSRIRWAYDNGAFLLRTKIHSYTSFNRQQKQEIRSSLDTYFNWHRIHLLPLYVKTARDLDRRLTDGFTSTDARLMQTDFRLLLRETMEPFAKPAAAILATLDDRQISRLERTLNQQAAKWQKKNMKGSLQDQLERRADRTLNVLEEWAGTITSEQERQIRVLSMGLPLNSDLWFKVRTTHQAKLIHTLREKAGADAIARVLLDWIHDPQSVLSEVERARFRHSEASIAAMAADVWGQLTPEQRVRARDKLLNYIGDFQDLSGQPIAALMRSW